MIQRYALMNKMTCTFDEWERSIMLCPRDNGGIILYADAEKWVGEEIAIIQNEKELAEEHLRLDTITWEKELKKKAEEIATLTDKLQEAQQNYDTAFGEWHRCIEEIAALKTFINEKLHLKYPHGANGCCCLFDDDENQIQWCSVHKALRDDVAALAEEIESHAWKISPAMAQAKIDELSREIAALKEKAREALK